jgi:Cu+-exporting ATPase
VTFEHGRIGLSEVAALLTSLGYEPTLHLGAVEARRADPAARRLWLRLGVAGFAFGNTMLISVASYLGLNSADHPGLKTFFGLLSLVLALPAVSYSASDYWRTAWLALRQRVITLDLPIAAGLAALFVQSAFEVLSARGDGYFDSLTGLVFFLLCGRLFQHTTYDRLAFDRDFKSFFPLSVRRCCAAGDEIVPLARVSVGDRLILRHGEMVPADAQLVEGQGVIDYSFVTGEAMPVEKGPGDHLYAGGKQLGAAIQIETVKPVSQSYLTSLWSHETFRKDRRSALDTLTNRFSRRFTLNVILIALGALLFWAVAGQSARGLKAFVSVLIVACPCALALAAPFALGTAQRLLARRRIFLKDPQVVEALARIRTIVFDKTGTLTTPETNAATFQGQALTDGDRAAVGALAAHSTHPYAVRIAAALAVLRGVATSHEPALTPTLSRPTGEGGRRPGEGCIFR